VEPSVILAGQGRLAASLAEPSSVFGRRLQSARHRQAACSVLSYLRHCGASLSIHSISFWLDCSSRCDNRSICSPIMPSTRLASIAKTRRDKDGWHNELEPGERRQVDCSSDQHRFSAMANLAVFDRRYAPVLLRQDWSDSARLESGPTSCSPRR
jgi:hypothetical protein